MTADIGIWRKGTCVSHAEIKFLGCITLYFSNQNYTVFYSFSFKGKRNLSLLLLIFSSWKIKLMSLILSFLGMRISSVRQLAGLYLLASAENRQQHLTLFTCLLSSCWIAKSSKSAWPKVHVKGSAKYLNFKSKNSKWNICAYISR